MASSYLHTRLFAPLPRAAVEATLQQPLGRPTPQLRALLDTEFRLLRHREPNSLVYFPDATWLDAHIDHLAALSGWDFLVLLAAQAAPYGRTELMRANGLVRQSSAIPCLAFAYGDAALAQSLAAQLPAGEMAYLHVVAMSESESCSLLLSRNSMQVMARSYGYLQHPKRLWLEQQHNSSAAETPWEEFEARCAGHAGSGSPLLQRWCDFSRQQHAAAVARATPAAPLDLGAQYFTDGKRVFFRKGADDAPVGLDAADPATFRVIDDFEGFGGYGADAQHLWYFGESMPCEFPAAMARLPQDSRFMTDGRHVYHDGHALEGVDARNVRAVPGSDWPQGFMHGEEFVTGYGAPARIPVDGATFRALGGSWYCDKDGVYELHDNELLVEVGFDPATFCLVQHYGNNYLCDGSKVAQARGEGLAVRPLKGVVAPSFRGVPGLPFVSDGKRVWLEIKPCKDLDAASLRVPPISSLASVDKEVTPDERSHCKYFISGDKAWYCDGDSYRVIAGADAASFELLGFGLARDARSVWADGEIVKGARAGAFNWTNLLHRRWSDGVGVYEYGERLPPQRATATLVELDAAHCTLEIIGDDYWFDGARIEGWTRATHRLAGRGWIEDSQHAYTCYAVEGGGILVWTLDYADHPLLHYVRDEAAGRWRATGSIPDAAQLAAMPTGCLVTREEFDTLFDCLPRGNEYGTVQSSFTEPAITVMRWRDARSLSISGDVRYGLMWTDEMCSEDLRPTRTPAICAGVRRALAAMLDTAPPLSVATLKQMFARVTASEGYQAFTIDAGGADGETFLLVQSGADVLRGAWIDAMEGEQVLRIGVWFDDAGFTCAEFLLGPKSNWGSSSNDGFVATASTAERRSSYRRRVQAFLAQVPAAGKEPNSGKDGKGGKGGKAAARVTAWCDDSLPALLSLLVPRLGKAARRKFIAAVRKAAIDAAQPASATDDTDNADLEARSEDAAWEAFHDALEEQELLVTFDKQELLQALELCNALASAAGIERRFELSARVRGDSFMEIAQDFERWLEPSGLCLVWPQGSFRSSGDDHFPVLVAPAGSIEELCNHARILGERRYFTETPDE